MSTSMGARGTGPGRERLWAIVLAGGEGVRLRPLTRKLYGEDRPKQFAALLGSRSLLRQTLGRVALAVAEERTVVVTRRAHAHFTAKELEGSGHLIVLPQPADRGTAAAILFAAHWIQWQDPGAIVAVFPADHFIAEEATFMGHVVDVTRGVARSGDDIVLLGAPPTSPDTEYGWIEPGEDRGWTAGRSRVRAVRRFLEKPSGETARACQEQGWLWNTLVVVARASALIDVGRRCLPELSDRLEHIRPFVRTPHEGWAIEQAYALAPKASFSRAVLEQIPTTFAVSRLLAVTWSDWGTPERVIESLRWLGVDPPWLDTYHRSA
jgi:mannose-1-phosphate guanylyltransferase